MICVEAFVSFVILAELIHLKSPVLQRSFAGFADSYLNKCAAKNMLSKAVLSFKNIPQIITDQMLVSTYGQSYRVNAANLGAISDSFAYLCVQAHISLRNLQNLRNSSSSVKPKIIIEFAEHHWDVQPSAFL